MLEYAYHIVGALAGSEAAVLLIWWRASVRSRRKFAQLTQQKLAADRQVGKLTYLSINRLDKVLDLRAEVSQLTRDIHGEIDRGNKLFDELADLKARALFRNAKGQMYSLNPAKKPTPKPVEVAPADRVMA